MVTKGTKEIPSTVQTKDVPQERSRTGKRSPKTTHVTEARAKAQRTKLDAQAKTRALSVEEEAIAAPPKKEGKQQNLQAKRRAGTTLERAIDDYLQDHEGGNHSEKTLEWHRTALGLLQTYLEEQREITLVGEVDAPDISSWFTHMRKVPGAHGKMRSERTIQTYARSARAFFHWLVRQGTLTDNPFARVVFPKVGKPLIQTITEDEFEHLLLACAAPNETGPIAERAAIMVGRNWTGG